MPQPSKNYSFFVKPYKPENEDKIVGHNYVGLPKSNFTFKMKVYEDLPVAIGDKKITYREYMFVKLPKSIPNQENKLYGIPLIKIKQNVQMPDCVNFFLGNNQPIPVIDLSNPSLTFAGDIFNTITVGMKKTKEFYEKNPPIKNQEIKVFETTINKNVDESFSIENLTNKYFNGFITLNNKKLANVFLPFDAQNKTFLVPETNYIDNQDGSFSLKNIRPDQMFISIPAKNLPEVKEYDFSVICHNKKAKQI